MAEPLTEIRLKQSSINLATNALDSQVTVFSFR
jgi:hypothetical protein